MASERKPFDSIIILLVAIIAVLLITGGIQVNQSWGKGELAQIDAFAWLLLILCVLRSRRAGSALPEALEEKFGHLLGLFEKKPKLILNVSVGLYVVLFTWLQVNRYMSFHANAYDLSYVDQPLWAAANHFNLGLKPLHSSISVNQTFLGEHFSPILLMIGQLFHIWDDVRILFFFQSLVLASGAFILFRLCREFQLKDSHAAFLSVCYLFYQPLRSANIFDFREDNLFVVLFLSLLLFMKTRSYLKLWITVLILFTVKENAAIFCVLTGIWMFIASRSDKKQKLHGTLLSVISIAAFIFINQKVTPYFSGTPGQTRFAFRMKQFGNTTGDFATYIISHPVDFLQTAFSLFFTKATLKYFLVVFTPFLLCFRNAVWPMLIALAGIALNILLGITSVGFHYECIFMAFLFFALVQAQSKVAFNTKSASVILVSFLLFYGRSPVYSITKFMPTEHQKYVNNALKKIPMEASVATHTALHPHITHRKDAFLFSGEATTDFVVADLDESIDRYGTPNLMEDLEKLGKNPDYELIESKDTFRIWKKKASQHKL